MELPAPSNLVVTTKSNKKMIDAFGAIVQFVNGLWDAFGKNTVDALALYHRLVGRIGLNDTDNIKKAVDGFVDFLKTYEESLMNNKLEDIPRGTVIKYGTSDKILLEIQKFIYQSDAATKETIRQHLLIISAILVPNKEKIAQLDKKINDLNIDTNTKEGKFITGIMEKAKNNMSEINTDNPMQAMMALFQSGLITDMVSGLQQGVGSGEMNIHALLGTMQSAIGAIIPPQGAQTKVEEIKEKKEQ